MFLPRFAEDIATEGKRELRNSLLFQAQVIATFDYQYSNRDVALRDPHGNSREGSLSTSEDTA